MPFDNKDKALIENLYQFKNTVFGGYTGGIFEDKLQQVRTGHFTKNIRETGSTDQRHESGRQKHARTEENVTTMDQLVGLLNQEGQKQTHRSTRYTSKKTDLTQCSIVQIIHRDLGL